MSVIQEQQQQQKLERNDVLWEMAKRIAVHMAIRSNLTDAQLIMAFACKTSWLVAEMFVYDMIAEDLRRMGYNPESTQLISDDTVPAGAVQLQFGVEPKDTKNQLRAYITT